MATLIAPLIGTSLELTLGLLRMARESGELKQKVWIEFKKQIDKEFNEFPTYDELRNRDKI